jgi:hypothetical protein
MDNFDLKKYLVENKVTTNSKMLNEGDWNTANNVMAIINQLLEMGKEGKMVLAVLERIPEWQELVSANQDADLPENKITTNSKMVNEETPGKPVEVKEVSFPNGTTFKKGEEDMEGGIVTSIRQYPNGYAVFGQEYDWNNREYEEEGYVYFYDKEGNEVEETEVM